MCKNYINILQFARTARMRNQDIGNIEIHCRFRKL